MATPTAAAVPLLPRTDSWRRRKLGPSAGLLMPVAGRVPAETAKFRSLLTLVLVPAVYTILDDAKELMLRAHRRLTGAAAPAPAPAAPAAAPAASRSRVLASPPPAHGSAED